MSTQILPACEESSQKWQPSIGTRLTLKQLGLKPIQIETSLRLFSAVQPNGKDSDFIKFALRLVRIPGQRDDRLKAVRTISLAWAPSTGTVAHLLDAGYWEGVICLAKDFFVIEYRENGYSPICFDAAFRSYLSSRWSLGGVCVELNLWRPGRASLNYLQLKSVSLAESKRLVEVFLSTSKGSEKPHKYFDREYSEFVCRWLNA